MAETEKESKLKHKVRMAVKMKGRSFKSCLRREFMESHMDKSRVLNTSWQVFVLFYNPDFKHHFPWPPTVH